jgi:hypothetical protein
MPRDGSCADGRSPLSASPCGRRGRYSLERLTPEQGDAKLTDLLRTLADGSKARSISIYDRCKAVYEESIVGED